MPYTPKPPPRLDPAMFALYDYLEQELQDISRQFAETRELDLRQSYREPDRPREGMVVYADGSSWNPGRGEGIYFYDGAAWRWLSTGTVGSQAMWIPANRMTPRTTNGAAVGLIELATNQIMVSTLDFDATTAEFAQFAIRMPKRWNIGTLTAEFVWSHAATVTNFGVVWGISARAYSNDDALDAAMGTRRLSGDTGGTTNDVYVSEPTTVMTPAGSAAEQDYVVFQVERDPTNGADTLAVDARLHGVTLTWTSDAETDD